MDSNDYFRCPSDLLSGSKRVHVVIVGWVCDGVVAVSAAEWAGLGVDPKQQQAFMAQRMQQWLQWLQWGMTFSQVVWLIGC